MNFSFRDTIWAFPCPSPPYFLLKHGIHDFVLDVAHSTKASSLSFLNSRPNLPIAVSIGFVHFPICALKSPSYSGLGGGLGLRSTKIKQIIL